MSSKNAEVVVVGAGIIGASVAFYLAQAGLKVTVVDSKGVASGATGSSGGLFCVHHDDPVQLLLAKAGWDEIAAWEETFGDSIGLVRTGSLSCMPSEQASRAQTDVAEMQKAGVECRLMDTEALSSSFPAVRWGDDIVAVFEANAGYADPRRMTRKYLERVVEMGGKTLTETQVEGLRMRNGRLSGLQTSSGFLETDTAVVATGAWSAMSTMLPGLVLPLRTKRIIAQRVEVEPDTSGLPACIDDAADGFWFRPDGQKQVLVGIGCQEWGLDPDLPLPAANKSLLKLASSRLQERLTQHSVKRVLEVKSGLDAYTPDGLPIIDKWSLVNGMYLAVGFSGGGFKVSPAVGRILSAWIVSGKKNPLLAVFGLGRAMEWQEPPAIEMVVTEEEPAQVISVQPEAIATEVVIPVSPADQDLPKRKKRKKKRKPSPEERFVTAGDQHPQEHSLQVRPVTEDDQQALVGLVLEYIDFYKRPQPDTHDLESLIKNLQANPEMGCQFVAVQGEELVGFATLYFTFSTLKAQKVAIMNDLFVKPKLRKKGIGKALFAISRDYVQGQGCAHMEWVTPLDNFKARAFYEKMGAERQRWLVFNVSCESKSR